MYKQLTKEDLAYIAGFLDGDGCILTQIVKGVTYKYKFTIRISIVFYQKKSNHWFLIWLKSKLEYGNIRIRNDGMAELVILGAKPVKSLLNSILPFLKLKHKLAILVLQIYDKLNTVKTEVDFIEVCKLVDKTIEYTYSKKRLITSVVVEETLKLPVETEKLLN